VDLSETESLNSTVTAGSIFEDLTELMTDTEESSFADSIELLENAVGDPSNSYAGTTSAGFTADSQYRILSWNCKAIRPRNEELATLAKTHIPHVICLQETNLNEFSSTPRIPEYTPVARVDRPRTDNGKYHGGGLLVFARENDPNILSTQALEHQSDATDRIGYSTVKVVFQKTTIILSNVYR